MITLNGVHFAYTPGREVLRGVDLQVAPGELLCLAGSNGSGKSTLLTLMAGLFVPDAGQVLLDESGSAPRAATERDLRACTGLVLQDADLQIVGATPREDLLLGVEDGDTAGITWALDTANRLGLEPWLDRPVQTLSYGQKRKLCIATALLKGMQGDAGGACGGRASATVAADAADGVQGPVSNMILLYDEPFSGLDYPGKREMRAMLAEMRRSGLTQVVANHDLEPVIDLADRVAVLHLGEKVLDGAPESVLPHMKEYGVRPPCSWSAGLGVRPWE